MSRGVSPMTQVRARIGAPVVARALPRDRREKRAIFLVGPERALPGREVMAQAGAQQLQARDRLQIAGDKREPHLGAPVQVGEQRGDARDHVLGEVARAQARVPGGALRAQVFEALVDVAGVEAQVEQDGAGDLEVRTAGGVDVRCARVVDPVHRA